MYNDTYVEVLVKKETKGGANILKFLLITLTVVFVILGMMIFLAFIPAAVCGILAYFVSLNADLEYEYLYVDRELTIDKVMAKTRRKKVETFDLERMEILAPLKSYHLDSYKNRTAKVSDYSSGVERQPEKRYAMYYDGSRKIILEPNMEFVKAVQTIAPRKVFMD